MFIISTYFCYVTITLFICSMELRFLITLQFDMFELRMEITLQLCFVFALHCDLFLLRYNCVIYLFDAATFFDNVRITLILVRLNYVWKKRYNYVLFLLVIVTYFLLRHNYIVKLRSNYVLKLRYKMVIFKLRLFVTKK